MAGIVIGAIVGSVVSEAVGAVVAEAVLGMVIESGITAAAADVLGASLATASFIGGDRGQTGECVAVVFELDVQVGAVGKFAGAGPLGHIGG